MHLNKAALSDGATWNEAGITLPRFDIIAAADKAKTAPVWIHFGVGNIFRAFPAAVWQELLEAGVSDTGLIAAEGYDYEIADVLREHDDLTLLVTLKADGTIGKTVIASVVETLKADSEDADFERLREVFRAPTLQMASFTITEKGYSIIRSDGSLPSDIAADFAAGPSAPISYMGKIAALCYERYSCGALPLALVSMDNCSHNGDKLRDAVSAFADAWVKNTLCDSGFADYIYERVSFPWTMIDKITPRPDDGVRHMLNDSGFKDTEGVVTKKSTFVAPFVNAEQTQWLVVEDDFPNGRPPLERGGIIFTTRETVDKVEKMKVCTCLNPLHTALAIFGCLFGYKKISDEVKDADLVRLIETIGYIEGLPVVVNPGILDPKAFIDNVVEVRLPNPFMPDTPQRIACDTSQKLSIRFGETIKAYMSAPDLDVQSLRAIPLVLAGWLNYLKGIDDNGEVFEPSPDPLLDNLRVRLSDPASILSDSAIFGVNLYEVGLGARVEALFAEMSASPGAIRAVLRRELDKCSNK